MPSLIAQLIETFYEQFVGGTTHRCPEGRDLFRGGSHASHARGHDELPQPVPLEVQQRVGPICAQRLPQLVEEVIAREVATEASEFLLLSGQMQFQGGDDCCEV